jgi:hypothetical protein
MWLTLASLVLGALPALLQELAAEKQNLLTAQTDQARIASQERIAALEARRDVLVAESRTPWNILIRGLLVAPFAIYIWKLVVVDKILCSTCSTEPLSDWLNGIAIMCLGFYFLKSK